MSKKILLSLLLIGAIGAAQLQAKNVWTLNEKEYEVDTLVYKHQVGPGTTYAKYKLPQLPMQISVLEVDVNNQYIDFETCLSGDKGVATEGPSSMYARNDRPGHDMVAATNGDFYFYQDPIEIGIPRSGQFRRNECVTNPVGRAAFVMTDDRRLFIDRVSFTGKVTAGDVTTRLHTVNMQRLEWENTNGNQLNLYTNSYGTQTEKCVGGTKVVISPKSGEFFWSANKNIEAVVETFVEGDGVSEIPAGKALLYGRGTSETFLKSLAVGATITLNLGTNLDSQPGLLTDFKELMGGSDNIILKDGVLVDEQLERHPRTCIGYNKDASKLYLILVDGRWANSLGATMGECAGIFLGLGAWNAINLDGGGSSCMVVNKEVVNNLSDGLERSVGNGCLLISKAPVDDVISKIGFEPRSKNILLGSKIRPIIYGYNQYGLLKDKNLKGVSFTCDPSIGRINEDGYFIAATTPGAGKLTAHYNGVEESMDIILLPVTVNLRLNSILLDGIRKYTIEVDGTNGVYKESLDPALFSWTSSDTQVCEIKNGIVSGLNNGETTIVGEGLGFKGELKVVVEVPATHIMAIDPEMEVSSWKISQAGGKDIAATPLDNGMKLTYTGAGGRAPNIKLSKKIKLWSLPDAIQLRMNPGSAPIKKLTISTITNQGIIENTIIDLPVANEMNVLTLPTEKWCDANDLLNYPIYLNYILFDMGNSTVGTNYTIEIPGIEAIYNSVPSSVDGIEIDGVAELNIFPNPVKVGENTQVKVANEGKADITIYNNLGQLISQSTVLVNGGVAELPLSSLSAGLYFVVINGQSSKVIIQ